MERVNETLKVRVGAGCGWSQREGETERGDILSERNRERIRGGQTNRYLDSQSIKNIQRQADRKGRDSVI